MTTLLCLKRSDYNAYEPLGMMIIIGSAYTMCQAPI